MIDIVAWPRSYWTRACSRDPSSNAGAISAIVAAERATCPAPTQTSASSRSCSRSVTSTKSHGCQLRDDGVRRAASRILSSSCGSSGSSVNERTLRRERIASQVSMCVLPSGSVVGYTLLAGRRLLS